MLLQPAWQFQRLPSNRPWIFASQDLLPRRRCSASALTKAWQWWQVSRKKKSWKFWNLFSAPELAAPNALSLSAILGCCDFATTIKNFDDFMHLLYHGILFFTSTTPRPVLWPRFKKITNVATVAHEAALPKKLWTKALLPHQGHCQHQSRSTSTQPIFQAPCFHIIRSCEIAGDLKAHPSAVAPKILSKKKLSQVAWLELRAVIAMGLGRFNQKNDP